MTLEGTRAGPSGGTDPLVTVQILPFLVTAGIFPAQGKHNIYNQKHLFLIECLPRARHCVKCIMPLTTFLRRGYFYSQFIDEDSEAFVTCPSPPAAHDRVEESRRRAREILGSVSIKPSAPPRATTSPKPFPWAYSPSGPEHWTHRPIHSSL